MACRGRTLFLVRRPATIITRTLYTAPVVVAAANNKPIRKRPSRTENSENARTPRPLEFLEPRTVMGAIFLFIHYNNMPNI